MMSDRPTTTLYVGISLDGFIARADGSLDWLPTPPPGDDFGWADFLASVDTILMGRNTFEAVLSFGAWPYEGTPVVVLSTTLRTLPPHLDGKATVTSGAPRDVLGELAHGGAKRVYVDGGATAQSFLKCDLIDELILTTVPVLIGEGIALFGPTGADLPWTLRSTEPLAGGLVKNTYARAR